MNLNLQGNLRDRISSETLNDEVKENLLPYIDLIFRCACRLTRKQHDAEDLTQEAFYFAIKNYGQLKDPTKARNWLFSILKNLFLKEIEKNRRRVDVEFDSVSHRLSSSVNLESEHLKLEVQCQVQEVLARLDDRLRHPIELFYFERLSYKEIADSLNLPIGTVMSRLARGKVHLKRALNRLEK